MFLRGDKYHIRKKQRICLCIPYLVLYLEDFASEVYPFLQSRKISKEIENYQVNPI